MKVIWKGKVVVVVMGADEAYKIMSSGVEIMERLPDSVLDLIDELDRSEAE